MAGEQTRGGRCGSIGFNAGNLTRIDGRMRVSPKGLPDKPRGSAWPSPARTVRRAVKSVKSMRAANNLRDEQNHNMEIMEICYLVGLWKADRCSTAKGVVGIKNKDTALLNAFRKIVEPMNLKVKSRTVHGFSTTQDVYVCNSRLRRKIEKLFLFRSRLPKKKLLAYFGGRIDGDGTVDVKSSHIRIYYSPKELSEAEEDSRILKRFGVKSVVKIYNTTTLSIHKPRTFASIIKNFVKSPSKRKKLNLLSA